MNLHLRASALVLAAVFVLFVSTPLMAQSSTAGRVSGMVTDPTGAVAPRAEMQLLNVSTNAALTATSDNSGGFIFPVVPPGIYRLTVKLGGFRTASITDIQIDVEKTLAIPVKLEGGGSTEVGEATAQA